MTTTVFARSLGWLSEVLKLLILLLILTKSILLKLRKKSLISFDTSMHLLHLRLGRMGIFLEEDY